MFLCVDECPAGVELQVNDIGPDEVGLFDCVVMNGIDLRWTVDGVPFDFPGGNSSDIGTIINMPNGIAVLLERSTVAPSSVRGNRTSVLRFIPAPNFSGEIEVRCGDFSLGQCSAGVLVNNDGEW